MKISRHLTPASTAYRRQRRRRRPKVVIALAVALSTCASCSSNSARSAPDDAGGRPLYSELPGGIEVRVDRPAQTAGAMLDAVPQSAADVLRVSTLVLRGRVGRSAVGSTVGSGDGRLVHRDTTVKVSSARGSDGSEADVPKSVVIEQFGFAPNGASFQEEGNPWLIEGSEVVAFVRPSDTSPGKYMLATAGAYVEVTQHGVQPVADVSTWMHEGCGEEAAAFVDHAVRGDLRESDSTKTECEHLERYEHVTGDLPVSPDRKDS